MDSESAAAAITSRGRGVVLLIFFLVLVLIGYPLSPGPVVALYGGNTPHWVDWFYLPLEHAARKIPAVDSFYSWYLPLWYKR